MNLISGGMATRKKWQKQNVHLRWLGNYRLKRLRSPNIWFLNPRHRRGFINLYKCQLFIESGRKRKLFANWKSPDAPCSGWAGCNNLAMCLSETCASLNHRLAWQSTTCRDDSLAAELKNSSDVMAQESIEDGDLSGRTKVTRNESDINKVFRLYYQVYHHPVYVFSRQDKYFLISF